ncbi:DegT/DnrJ/EryC1/StrS family aminotransferase [Micromonospora echinofusca]|uniref:Glutamine--scyllo-inositol aminotransferase n=1 Tax=Micromonospora echinofusca TaxID=47858 RepID=A0ABS3VRP9_MICEH|nr:DegT/DnrJ/EryC1/StrS family aminotransferase [Micromonospora echinofusca]MBO4207203.1 glutamine--scyllo-inositol aminotransferase [Micromonospora echinofusca]
MSYPSMADADGRTLGAEEIEAVTRALRTGMLSSVWGTEVRALEREMAALHAVPHAVACSSGTAALHLAVAAVAPEPGDEIITSPISDIGTVAPILAQNAVPVFADVDPYTGNLDPDAVAAAIGPRTRAILGVHLFGAAATGLRAVADAAGLPLIEDCAQAWLTRYPDDRLAGTVGTIGCFSLQQWKHITCGDGGLVVTGDATLARRMRLFADKGWPRDGGTRRYVSLGLNYRMTELAGAVARAQLAKLPGVLAARRRTARRLVAALADLPGVHLPADPDRHAWWLFPIVLDPPLDNADVAARLAAEGVPARAGYLDEPLHCAPVLTEAPCYGTSRYPLSTPPADRVPEYGWGTRPNAERLVTQTLLVIQWNERYTDEHVDRIAAAVRRAVTR